MSEHLSHHEELENVTSVESRFGDKDHFCEVLLHNEGRVLGDLKDYAEISDHQNTVKLAEVATTIEHNQPKNSITTYYFGQEGNKPILGVFKPLDGENPNVHQEYHIDRFDVREVLAYQVSEHFGFDLVPPTVHREINGQVGSLQLFIPQESHQTIEWVEQHSGQSHLYFARNSTDWEMMAAFDYIIGNPDRHARNVLARYDLDGNGKVEPVEGEYGTELIAIDNGTSFSSAGYYDRNTQAKGPSADLSYSLDERQPLQIELPEYLIDILKNGLANRKDLNIGAFSETIEPGEITSMWQRAEDLVKTGVFLSRYNEKAVFGY